MSTKASSRRRSLRWKSITGRSRQSWRSSAATASGSQETKAATTFCCCTWRTFHPRRRASHSSSEAVLSPAVRISKAYPDSVWRCSRSSILPSWMTVPAFMKMRASHISPSSERIWELMSSVFPRALRRCTRFLNSRRALGSNPAAGSSRMRNCASLISVRARQSRCVCPLESLSIIWFWRPASSVKSITSSTASSKRSLPMPQALAKKSRYSRTLVFL